VSHLAALRQTLEQRYPDAVPLIQRVAPSVATGVAALDGILPGGGLPRAALTAWHSEGGAGAVLRATARAVLASGERAAWIDGAGVSGLEPAELRDALIVRPPSPLDALRSAEALLRSGGLTLLVLAGTEPEGPMTTRLTRAAREGGTALVILARHVAVASLRLSSRLLPNGYRWLPGPFGTHALPDEAMLEIRVRTLGWQHRATIPLPVAPYELRLSPDSGLADRRGAQRVRARPAR